MSRDSDTPHPQKSQHHRKQWEGLDPSVPCRNSHIRLSGQRFQMCNLCWFGLVWILNNFEGIWIGLGEQFHSQKERELEKVDNMENEEKPYSFAVVI